jgi:hypothetical protein
MFKFLSRNIDYIVKLIEYLETLGYEQLNEELSETIPNELFRDSKFKSYRMINSLIDKQIEILKTSKNTIASFNIMDLNHRNPDQQYCDPTLTTTLNRISNKKFKHFEVFGFNEFGKKQYRSLIKLINENITYLTTDSKLPIGNIEIYPGFTDLCNIKDNLNQVMFEYEYLLIQDSSKYNPIFTKPEFWYKKNQQVIKFIRRKSRDENYIYAVKDNDSIEKNIFHYGTYEAGKQFAEFEWKTIKERLRTTLDMT